MRAVKFGVDMFTGAAIEGISQVAMGRDAPMTGPATLGGAVGSMAVKYLASEVKGATSPYKLQGLQPRDRAAFQVSPLLLSNQGRQHFQAQGMWDSREIARHQRESFVMEKSYPERFASQESAVDDAMGDSGGRRRFD